MIGYAIPGFAGIWTVNEHLNLPNLKVKHNPATDMPDREPFLDIVNFLHINGGNFRIANGRVSDDENPAVLLQKLAAIAVDDIHRQEPEQTFERAYRVAYVGKLLNAVKHKDRRVIGTLAKINDPLHPSNLADYFAEHAASTLQQELATRILTMAQSSERPEEFYDTTLAILLLQRLQCEGVALPPRTVSLAKKAIFNKLSENSKKGLDYDSNNIDLINNNEPIARDLLKKPPIKSKSGPLCEYLRYIGADLHDSEAVIKAFNSNITASNRSVRKEFLKLFLGYMDQTASFNPLTELEFISRFNVEAVSGMQKRALGIIADPDIQRQVSQTLDHVYKRIDINRRASIIEPEHAKQLALSTISNVQFTTDLLGQQIEAMEREVGTISQLEQLKKDAKHRKEPSIAVANVQADVSTAINEVELLRYCVEEAGRELSDKAQSINRHADPKTSKELLAVAGWANSLSQTLAETFDITRTSIDYARIMALQTFRNIMLSLGQVGRFIPLDTKLKALETQVWDRSPVYNSGLYLWRNYGEVLDADFEVVKGTTYAFTDGKAFKEHIQENYQKELDRSGRILQRLRPFRSSSQLVKALDSDQELSQLLIEFPKETAKDKASLLREVREYHEENIQTVTGLQAALDQLPQAFWNPHGLLGYLLKNFNREFSKAGSSLKVFDAGNGGQMYGPQLFAPLLSLAGNNDVQLPPVLQTLHRPSKSSLYLGEYNPSSVEVIRFLTDHQAPDDPRFTGPIQPDGSGPTWEDLRDAWQKFGNIMSDHAGEWAKPLYEDAYEKVVNASSILPASIYMLPKNEFHALLSYYVACSISQNESQFFDAVDSMVKSVKPGGILTGGFMELTKDWPLGDMTAPSGNVTMKRVVEAFHNAGADVIVWRVDAPPVREGDRGILAFVAIRRKSSPAKPVNVTA